MVATWTSMVDNGNHDDEDVNTHDHIVAQRQHNSASRLASGLAA